jgi:hypothetical protein
MKAITVEDVLALLRQQAEGQADALTEAAVTIRTSGLTFTGEQVADMLTGFAAGTNASAARVFGGAA